MSKQVEITVVEGTPEHRMFSIAGEEVGEATATKGGGFLAVFLMNQIALAVGTNFEVVDAMLKEWGSLPAGELFGSPLHTPEWAPQLKHLRGFKCESQTEADEVLTTILNDVILEVECASTQGYPWADDWLV